MQRFEELASAVCRELELARRWEIRDRRVRRERVKLPIEVGTARRRDEDVLEAVPCEHGLQRAVTAAGTNEVTVDDARLEAGERNALGDWCASHEPLAVMD